MWMGGPVPLGYDVRDRKLVVKEAEAETVRSIFKRYLELGSVRELMAVLKEEDICTKQQRSARGGIPFGPLGALVHFPAKFKLRVLDPVHFDVPPDQPRYSRSKVMDEAESIRQQIQDALYDMLRARASVWRG